MGKSTSTNPDPQSGQQFSGAKKVFPWLCRGLYLQSVDWDGPLCEVAQEARASPEALLGLGSYGGNPWNREKSGKLSMYDMNT